MKRQIILNAALALVGSGFAAHSAWAVDTGPAPTPTGQTAAPATTQPSAPLPADQAALIKQLGDDDFHVRQDAAKKLQAMGKAAGPALHEALKSQDPEVHARAQELLQEIDRPPALPVPQGKLGGSTMSNSVSVSVINGAKSIDVSEPGRTVHIDENKDGIAMKVTGQIDGKEVTRDYKAKSADDLKKDNPDAFKLYEQYAGNGNVAGIGLPNGINGNFRLNVQGNGVINIQPGVVGGAGGVINIGPGGAVMVGPNGIIQPANQPKLGIISGEEKTPGEGITVIEIIPGTRAEKMGLKEQDKIQKANGQDIHNVDDLRKAIADHPKNGLVLEGTRDGKPLKLEEKAD